jgi:heme o synthase
MKASEKIKQYYLLAKPGIVYGNTFAAIAGYFLATDQFSAVAFLQLVLGIALVLASAGYANNIMDIRIDRKMDRTKKRPLVTGSVPIWAAYVGSGLFLALGLLLLSFGKGDDHLAVIFGILGWAGYLFLYGFTKRRTHHATLIGALPGALPPLIGYTFAAGSLDLSGGLLFLMMVFWQMPHFYGISLFRQKEYEAANIPILPSVKGRKRVLSEMRIYVVLYTLASLALVFVTPLSVPTSLILLITALWWCGVVAMDSDNENYIRWARNVFKTSLFILLLWPIAFFIDFLVR